MYVPWQDVGSPAPIRAPLHHTGVAAAGPQSSTRAASTQICLSVFVKPVYPRLIASGIPSVSNSSVSAMVAGPGSPHRQTDIHSSHLNCWCESASEHATNSLSNLCIPSRDPPPGYAAVRTASHNAPWQRRGGSRLADLGISEPERL